MAQTLVLGLGGTGSRVVNSLAKILHARGERINDGKMCCAVFDTNKNDIGDIVKSGTEIPVIPTSKPQKIKKYISDYSHLDILDWCPESPAFLKESMIDGASEVRLKSRIAFLDCTETEIIKELEGMINEVLDNNESSKIRIMIVSSIAGGTGSGMFIQVALWLRKFLKDSQISIRGIFLLPDVFINTVEDVRKNKTTQARHYCNAYAAIRELNAISKIREKNSVKLSEKITVGKLFDSELDADLGEPVYDLAFFVDYRDENGISLKGLSDYEELVAQMVYMQMKAPMKDDMYSEEDNSFLAIQGSAEPLYGSCGTAKAVYPVDSVRDYCILRAAQDCLSLNWKKIDDEIEALKNKRSMEEAEGRYSDEIFDFAYEYIKIFEKKTSRDRKNSGKDRFFLSIAKDANNGKAGLSPDGRTCVKYTDKIEDYIKLIRKQMVDVTVSKYGELDELLLDEKSFVKKKRSVDELIKVAEDSEFDFENTLDSFDENVAGYADNLIDEVIPYSMGEVSANNVCSVYSLFLKNDPESNAGKSQKFVHPVAARYMLYRLREDLNKELRRIAYDVSRDEALSGGDKSQFFDNKKTKATEENLEDILKSKKWYQRKELFVDYVEEKYVEFINNKVGLCRKYEKERLEYELFTLILERLESVISEMTVFFNTLEDVMEKIEKEVALNSAGTKDRTGKTIYVCGKKSHKEKIYKSLELELEKTEDINKSMINTVYGCFCAKERSKDINNAPYVDVDIAAAFYSQITKDIGTMIDDKNNFRKVNMDIYTAICKEFEFENGTGKKVSGIESVNISDGSIEEENFVEKYNAVFKKYLETIRHKAAPFLVHDVEPTKNDLGCTTMREKTFWGFHPDVSTSCPNVGAMLGINEDCQSDERYLRNELYCYRAVYGIAAKYIPNFNELNGGKYYTCYKTIIDEMVAAEEAASVENKGRALISTPHLDKRWHEILPYVSAEKEEADTLGFYHTFWLAVAYGLVYTDKDGIVNIKKYISGGYGKNVVKSEPLTYEGKKLTKTDVPKILTVLRSNQMFMTADTERLNKKFKEELSGMSTYIGTEVLRGLLTENEDLNPVNVICRNHEALNQDIQVSSYLLGALEKIAEELAEKYNVDRSVESVEASKYKICKRIYDSSSRKKGKEEIFSTWIEAFKEYHID